ncbi:MAG: tetratricopeptide repeat protein [Pirellulales bacterium]|nr:tetratricopeptide repeat protein [Pirellulales bacterium]
MSKEPLRIPQILELYEKYLDVQDPVAFMRQVTENYAQGTLQRLAVHGVREVRRAAVLAMGLLGDYECNHTLGRALLDEDRTVRTLADNALRAVWTRAGTVKDQQELGVIVRLSAAQQYAEAIRRASKLLARAPWFAEAWHQRGVAQFALGHYGEAIRDCHETLEINPYQFVAAATMGQAYLELKNPVSALECFRRALRLNPDLEGVRAQVVRLARMVEDR